MNKKNAKVMAAALLDSKIENKFFHIGIMATIAKECGFELEREKSYSRTSNDRIRKIFPSRTKKLTDEQLTRLKSDDVTFFNHVYGGKIGNNRLNDGYNYRGAGWPQLTGKSNSKRYCPEWIAIDALPSFLGFSPEVASEVAIRFFSAGILKRAVLRLRHGKPTTDEIGTAWAVNIAAGIGRGKNSAVFKRANANAKKHIEEVREIYEEVKND